MSRRAHGQHGIDHATWLVKLTSPLHFAITLVIGVWLQSLLDLPLPAPAALAALQLAGGLIALAGLGLALHCFVLFAGRRTTIMPAGAPSRLVIRGAYRFSRNPMYLALVLSYAGLCLQLGRPWALLLLPLPVLALQWRLIPFEERRLQRSFGAAYIDYCRRVRRWL